MHWKRFVCAGVAAVAFLAVDGRGAEVLPAETELLAVLRSDAAEADKALACKKLAVKGSAAAVGDLAKLLANERLASWARIPLEAIPGSEADAALRSAAGTLSGRLLVGVINTIGVRRDAAATGLLAGKLADPDAEVAAAAAAALGKIGSTDAAAAIAKAMAAPAARIDDLAQAAIVCAARLAAAGRKAEAVSLYENVRAANVSEQRLAEATRGLILARGGEGIPLLVETLRSPSRRLANIGLFTARELLDGPQAGPVDLALAEEVTRMAGTPAVERAALLVKVLADRNADGGAGAGLQAKVLAWAASGPQAVRLAALEAVGRIGDPSAVDPLLALASDAAVTEAVRAALAALPGDAVDRVVLGRLSGADPKLVPVLAQVIGVRRIPAGAQLKPLLASGDAATRTAVLDALGAVIDLDSLPVLVDAVQKPRDAADAEAARKALQTACIRMPDRDACAAKLEAAIGVASGETKIRLLEIVGEVGGTKALAAVEAAAKSGDDALADAATRLLGKWMTADVAPVLLGLSAAPIGEKYQTRAIRGYIRVARQFALADAERAEMCQKAIAAAKDPDDRRSVLEILPRYPGNATLAVAEEATKLPGLAAEAKAAADAIRAKLPASAAAANPWLLFEGGEGPGKGKQVVLVSGDEEYRSEEALTQLAKILAKHHGFNCTVLYAIDPKTGEINPNEQKNIPGLEALRKADLMVIATRFRNLPDEQMKEIDDYLRAGKPVVGMRTATHAFDIPADRPFHHYSWKQQSEKWPQGFGRQVLGETWIDHHGHHGHESTRGLIAPGAKDHPILRGIKDGDIWGPTDVYGVRLPLPGDSQPLVLGQVLEGMKPDSPVVTGADAKKNEPMMPVAWVKTYSIEGGSKGRVFTTTMGAATDLVSTGVRRLLVNACYWAVGLEAAITPAADVNLVGTYEPTPFGFNGGKKGLKPADLR